MKKQVSVRELKDFCERNSPNQITYYTENQTCDTADGLCKLRLHFQVVLIYENPNQVCLKSGINSICFNGVRFAEIDTESTVLGTILTLYCGNSRASKPTATYTLILS